MDTCEVVIIECEIVILSNVLLLLVDHHVHMKAIVAEELDHLINRPNISEKAQ